MRRFGSETGHPELKIFFRSEYSITTVGIYFNIFSGTKDSRVSVMKDCMFNGRSFQTSSVRKGLMCTKRYCKFFLLRVLLLVSNITKYKRNIMSL